MKTIIVNDSDAGQRLDKYLKKTFSEAGSGFIYKMLRKKNIVLNGKKSDGTDIIHAGDEIKVFFSDETFEKLHKFFSDSEIVAIVGFAGQMIATNNFNSVLKIDVDKRLLPIINEFKPATWRNVLS